MFVRSGILFFEKKTVNISISRGGNSQVQYAPYVQSINADHFLLPDYQDIEKYAASAALGKDRGHLSYTLCFLPKSWLQMSVTSKIANYHPDFRAGVPYDGRGIKINGDVTRQFYLLRAIDNRLVDAIGLESSSCRLKYDEDIDFIVHWLTQLNLNLNQSIKVLYLTYNRRGQVVEYQLEATAGSVFQGVDISKVCHFLQTNDQLTLDEFEDFIQLALLESSSNQAANKNLIPRIK